MKGAPFFLPPLGERRRGFYKPNLTRRLPQMNQREMAFLRRRYHNDRIDPAMLTPIHQQPVLRPETFVPERLFPLPKVREGLAPAADAAVETFHEDELLERVWSHLDLYLERLRPFGAVFTLDFSARMDWPKDYVRQNAFRSKLFGQIVQRNGMHAIPVLIWASRDTFHPCFDGIPERSVVAVSTQSVLRRGMPISAFREGFLEAVRFLEPSTILFYGTVPALDFDVRNIVQFETWSSARRRGCVQQDLFLGKEAV